MRKSLFSIIITLLLGMQFSFAQSYVLSGIEKTDKEGMQYEVLGKVANHYWIFKKMVQMQPLHSIMSKCN